VVLGGLQVVVAWLWRDGLQPCPQPMLLLHYLAFMAQTFLFHAGVGLLIGAVFALLARRYRLLVAALVLSVCALAPSVWHAIPRAGSSDAQPSLEIMSANLHYTDVDVVALLKLVRESDPGIIVFQEWTSNVRAAEIKLALQSAYPYASEQARDDAFGQAIFSKHPFVGVVKVYPPQSGWVVPQMSFAIDVGGKPIRICNVHVLPPIWQGGGFAEQRQMIASLASWASGTRAQDRPHVFIGDFNAVDGTSMLSVLKSAGYVESWTTAEDRSFGRGSTWPSEGPLSRLPGVRLDNAFVERASLQVLHSEVLDTIGSDHRPILIRVRWAHERP
jgi:endonuclease/exonuclease/phosphatase (EEP) superfamily protein YafD